jgi:hypothetical protein
MFQSLKKVEPGDRWRKELAGAPTYVAGALLAWRYAEWSIVGSFLIFVCFLIVYHYAFEFLFPRFESRGRLGKLGAFFGTQIAFWALVLYVLSLSGQ